MRTETVDMTILARRFAIICLMSGIFAVTLLMAVESGSRRGQLTSFDLGAPCPQSAGLSCRGLF